MIGSEILEEAFSHTHGASTVAVVPILTASRATVFYLLSAVLFLE